jgi:hypothetical protein
MIYIYKQNNYLEKMKPTCRFYENRGSNDGT